MSTTVQEHRDNLSAIYWAEVAGDHKDRIISASGNSSRRSTSTEVPQVLDTTRVFTLESQADLHALRAASDSTPTVYVIAVPGGFRLSATEESGAVTRWMRYGCTSLRGIVPLVEMRF